MPPRAVRNVLWIVTDSQHHEALGVLGRRPARTPNLDRLAGRARLFTHAYCQSPVCVPSRESFITGRHGSQVGVWHNRHDFAGTHETLGHWFRRAGYATAFAGKSHFVSDLLPWAGCDIARGFERDADWDDLVCYWRECGFFAQFDSSRVAPYLKAGDPREQAQIEGAVNAAVVAYARAHGGHIAHEFTPEYVAARAACDWLERNHERPFFLLVSLYKPHGPHIVPEDVPGPHPSEIPPPVWDDADIETTPSLRQRLAFTAVSSGYGNLDLAHRYSEEPERSQRVTRRLDGLNAPEALAAYYRSLTYADRLAGVVLDKLVALGHDGDTAVVFTSDHGDHLGDHGLSLKMSFYDSAVRVPLLVRVPGVWEGGRDARPVGLVDLAPTLLALCDVPAPPDLAGRDLVGDSWGAERPVFSEIEAAFAPEVAAYGLGTRVRMVRAGEWKYLVKTRGPDELFHLDDDPGENHNLGADARYVGVRRRLRRLMDDHLPPLDATEAPRGTPTAARRGR